MNKHEAEGGRSFAVSAVRRWINVLVNTTKSHSVKYLKVHLFKRILEFLIIL